MPHEFRRVVGARITEARGEAGMTKRALAEKLGVDEGTVVDWELHGVQVHPKTVEELAKGLGYSVDFFYTDRRVPAIPVHYRARPNVREDHRFAAASSGQIIGHLISQLETSVGLPPADIERYELVDPASEADEIEAIATDLRRRWDLGNEPIVNLVACIEAHGIPIVFSRAAEVVDGFTIWIPGRPVIFSNSRGDPYRHRFSDAHELGHALFHFDPLPVDKAAFAIERAKREHQAHRFAAAFLLPDSKELREELETAFRRRYWTLAFESKEKWGVSQEVLVRRARELGVIDEDAFASRIGAIRRERWATKEPGTRVFVESPSLLANKLDELDSIHENGVAELVKRAGIPERFVTEIRRRA